MRYFLLLILSIVLANAQVDSPEIQDSTMQTVESEKEKIQAKLLYQSYVELPQKLFKGQIFALTIKALSANEDYESLSYAFSNAVGLHLLSEEHARKVETPYIYDTFYFQVKGNHVRIPDATTSLIFNDTDRNLNETLIGEIIETVRLNPEKDFSKILANDFRIIEYKTSQYDNQHNIVVFSAEADMGNLQDFSLKAAVKEGIDIYEEDLPHSTITYYAVVSKQLNEIKFSYFDLNTRRFSDVIIPVIVENDRVSTQTDLAPTQNSHAFSKIIIATLVSVLGLALFIIRRKKAYLLIFIIPLFFIAKLSVPIRHVCIKPDSNIYLLPMTNGTIFEQVAYEFTTEELGVAEGFTKIQMPNKQIGWVKDEDLCND